MATRISGWTTNSEGPVNTSSNTTAVNKGAARPDASAQLSTGSRVVTRADWEGKRPDQMRFKKGDEIEVVLAEGKWHTGILRVSAAYQLTGETLKFPPNYVKPKV